MIIKLKGSNIFSGLGNISELGKPYSVTVTCATPGSTITITATGMTTVTSTSGTATMTNIPYGTRTYYTVSAEGYTTKEGSTVSGGTIPVALTAVSTGGDTPTQPTTYTFTINPTPSTATVTLTASGYSQSGNSITVPANTVVTWKVSATGYTQQTGTYTVTKTESKSVALIETGNTVTGKTTTTYTNPSFVMQTTGQLATSSNTWIHSDFIPVSDLSNSDDDGKCVRKFVSHGTVAAIAFYSDNNFNSYTEGYVLTSTVSKAEAQTAEEVKSCITNNNSKYVVFSTDGSKAELKVTTGFGSVEEPDVEEPEIPSTPGLNYYEHAGFIGLSTGQVTNPTSDWIHSDFIEISKLEDSAELNHCIGKFTGHSTVADIAFYRNADFSSFIIGKSSAGGTKTVAELQALMSTLNATDAKYIVISTDKTKNQLYANLK